MARMIFRTLVLRWAFLTRAFRQMTSRIFFNARNA